MTSDGTGGAPGDDVAPPDDAPTLDPDTLAEVERLYAAANAALHQAEAARAASSLLTYTKRLNPQYLAGWVHIDICRRLRRFSDACRAGLSPRLILAMPPRHGKSELVSRTLPNWHLGRNPSHEVVLASYSSDLAKQLSGAARVRAAQSAAVFPAFAEAGKVKRGARKLSWTDAYWQIPGGGSCSALGVDSSLTGKGAHMLIVDDPIKDMASADSPAIRRHLLSWWQSVAYTRLTPGGGVLVMATRWHTDDLTGHLLREMRAGGDQYEVVSYPAIAEEDERHRRAGEALFPERYTLEHLERIRRVLSPRQWAALYQQSPTVEEGGAFRRDWFANRYDVEPHELGCTKQWISVDATFKDGATSDFCAIQVWGRRGPNYYLLKRINRRLSYVGLKDTLRDVSAAFPAALTKVIEAAANGHALISEMRKEVPGIVAYKPNASKRERAEVASVPLYAAGNVWLPTPRLDPGIGDYIEQHVGFMGGAAHDDEVDCTSQALLYERRMSSLGA